MAAFSIDGGLASPSEPREVFQVSKFSSGWDCENCIGSSWDCHRFKRWDCQSLCPQAENYLKYSQVFFLLFALRLLSDWGLAGWQRGMYLAPEMLRVVRCLNQWRVWVGKLPDLVSHRSMAHGPSWSYGMRYGMIWYDFGGIRTLDGHKAWVRWAAFSPGHNRYLTKPWSWGEGVHSTTCVAT